MNNKNTWTAKLKRTLTSVLPIVKNRTGQCLNCGACCKLPNVCYFLKYKSDGSSYCSIHSLRPLNCRKYPRTESEHITKETCGFKFKSNKILKNNFNNMITYEDFKKLEIKIGKIISAEKAEGADKLLKLIFDIGGEERQIMSAISEYYPDPSVLVGKAMPILTNLEPRTFRGHISQGMIIAADVDGYPILLHPEKDIPAGSPVK